MPIVTLTAQSLTMNSVKSYFSIYADVAGSFSSESLGPVMGYNIVEKITMLDVMELNVPSVKCLVYRYFLGLKRHRQGSVFIMKCCT